jgi:hypothetical protein
MRTTVTFRSRPTSVVPRHRKVAKGVARVLGELATPFVAKRSPGAGDVGHSYVALCEVDFWRQRRPRMGPFGVPPKRYVRCVVDVNDVDVRVLAVCVGCRRPSLAVRLSRQRQTAPVRWPELAECDAWPRRTGADRGRRRRSLILTASAPGLPPSLRR